jgi:hypothetical protein
MEAFLGASSAKKADWDEWVPGYPVESLESFGSSMASLELRRYHSSSSTPDLKPKETV